MLTIRGGQQGRFCDGISRRSFLQIGSLGLAGLSLPQLLRAEAKGGIRSSQKSVIMVYLPGGPPHLDMFDLKPDAPREIRGPYKPIKTNVPGIEVGELLPKIASIADKLVFLRTIVGAIEFHGPDQCLSGYQATGLVENGGLLQSGHPALGPVAAKLLGAADKSVPPFVSLTPRKMDQQFYTNPGDPAFLGPAYGAFRPDGPGLSNMTLNGVTLDRLAERKSLLTGFDSLRRRLETGGQTDGMETFTQQAFDLLTSNKVVRALSLEGEDPRVREMYGRGSLKNVGPGGPFYNEHLLIARRLVEAGVRCVTLAYGWWDYHSQNFPQCDLYLPKLDQVVYALVQDLHERGLDRDVSVVVWGEFGRSPKVNPNGGRDHWPQVSCGMLAGGGMRTGQVIGSTNRLGEVPKDRPVHFQNVFASLYRNLGIDPVNTTLPDHSGRPTYLLDEREPIPELM